MFESILLLPSALRSSESSDTNNKFIRDLFLLSAVVAVDCYGVSTPRRFFVVLLLYSLACEVVNDLTYKILEPKKILREQWLALQKRQTVHLLHRAAEETAAAAGAYGGVMGAVAAVVATTTHAAALMRLVLLEPLRRWLA
jgi:hypothetical protein